MLNALINMAALPDDAPKVRQKKKIAVALTLAICLCGIGWAATYYLAGLVWAAIPPAAYVVFSAANLAILSGTRKYDVFLFGQTLFIALLPFAMHQIMGGFDPGSAVILWSLLAPVSLLYIKGIRQATPWFIFFAVMVVAAGVQELAGATFSIPGMVPPEAFKGVFFMFNIIGVGGVAVFSIAHFVKQKTTLEELQEKLEATINELNESNQELVARDEELRQNLEELQATQESLQHINQELLQANNEIAEKERKMALSEKMSALGQLVAGVAHEVNTPLGAIKASIGTIRRSLETADETQQELAEELAKPKIKSAFFQFLKETGAQKQELSSRELRRKRKELTALLEENGVEKAARVADLLVELGWAEIPESAKRLLAEPKGPDFVNMAYEVRKQRANIANIENSVERASKIVFALKNYSRQRADGNLEKASIPETLDTVLTIYYNQMKNGVEVNTEYEDLPEIACFPDSITQVWTNILHNALQAMSYKGEIDVSARRDGQFVRVEISDSGPGIPPEVQPRIFEPFFSTKKAGEGSGLGLDIVKKIVDRHHGEITFETRPGKTTFIVKLPLNLEPQWQKEQSFA